jgi:hypothetical protein
MEDLMGEATFGSEPDESMSGADTGLDREETSQSSDVRAGYEGDVGDKPPERVVEESSEDDIDSHAADIASGYEDGGDAPS